MEPRKPDIVDAVLPPDHQFLTADQLEEIWNLRGMKYRIDKLHVALLNRGLVNYVDRPMFRNMIWDILEHFLVQGRSQRNPKYELKTRFPKVR